MTETKNLQRALGEKGFFDRKKLARNHQHSSPQKVQFLLDNIDTNLKDRISLLKTFPEDVVNYGSHKGTMGQWLKSCKNYQEFSDPDYDIIDLPAQSVDLFYSCLNFHEANHLGNTLTQVLTALKPKGVFVGAIFGEHTLCELKDCFIKAEANTSAKPHVHPFRNLDDVVALMRQAGFDMPVVDRDTLTIHYDELNDLYADIKCLGETNALKARFKGLTPASLFEKVEDIYKADYAHKDGTLPVTFDVIYITGWKT